MRSGPILVPLWTAASASCSTNGTVAPRPAMSNGDRPAAAAGEDGRVMAATAAEVRVSAAATAARALGLTDMCAHPFGGCGARCRCSGLEPCGRVDGKAAVFQRDARENHLLVRWQFDRLLRQVGDAREARVAVEAEPHVRTPADCAGAQRGMRTPDPQGG